VVWDGLAGRNLEEEVLPACSHFSSYLENSIGRILSLQFDLKKRTPLTNLETCVGNSYTPDVSSLGNHQFWNTAGT
jgi:hypothetical protein